MKKITHISIILFLLISLNQLSSAQTQQGYYMHVDYIKIQKYDIPAFEKQIASTLKPIQQARIENESIAGWYIYRVAYPASQNPGYNYVLISLDESLGGFDNAAQEIASKISESDETMMRRMIIPYRSELWRINNSVLTSDNTKASKYFIMDYMDVPPGMEYAYQMMEDEIALPIHEHRMDIDQMNGWELFSLIVPGGTEYGYNYATGNYFSDLTHFEFGFTEEIIRQSHPDTDINEINENIEQTRDLVRSEVWELIDYAK